MVVPEDPRGDLRQATYPCLHKLTIQVRVTSNVVKVAWAPAALSDAATNAGLIAER